MGQTTIKLSNSKKPAPRWFRKLDNLVLVVVIPVMTLIIQGWGFPPEKKKAIDRVNLIVAVVLPVAMKGMGQVLANGEEYKDETP